MKRPSVSPGSPRRGAILQETALAVVILTGVIVGTAQMMSQIARQHRLSEERFVAVLEAGNLMEELVSRSWKDLAEPESQTWRMSDAGRRRLPDARVDVEVTAEQEDRELRRLTLTIDWQAAGGQRSRPVKLVAWRYAPAEDTP